MPWADLLAWSDEHDLLAKRLYAVLSEPVSGLQPVLDNLEAHVAYQTRLENEGVMFAAASPCVPGCSTKAPSACGSSTRAASRGSSEVALEGSTTVRSG
jgi:hypothetical protein